MTQQFKPANFPIDEMGRSVRPQFVMTDTACAFGAAAIVVNTPFPGGLCRAVYVGTTGDLTAVMGNGGSVTFTAVPAGIFPIQCTNITAATASNMVAMY